MTKKRLPPNSHRVRGLGFNKLNPEMQGVVKKIAKIVLESNGRLDMQIRDGYVSVYYSGGCIWKVNHISPKSRGIIIETDKKYFKISKNKKADSSWLPRRTDGIEKWNRARARLEKIMDEWFVRHPKQERDLQHTLACNHVRNPNSKWIILDTEYAAWLHGTKDKKKADDCRRLCRYDMIGIERRSLEGQSPIIVYIMELKQGDGAVGGKSGITSHAEDIAQLISDKRDEKALTAFMASMHNIIHEKAAIGVLPSVPKRISERIIEPRAAFILHDSSESAQEKEIAQKILSGCCDKILWLKYKTMFGEQ